MTDLARPCAGRGRLAAAALALSGMLLFNPAPAAADCGGGPLSTSAGNLIGSALGGAAGGLIGNQFGHGSGKGVMTGVGVVGGALAGGYVGRSVEGCPNAPRRAAAAPASYHAPRRHAAAPANTAHEARTCRFVLTQAAIDGREQQIDGVACLEADGSWKTASGAAAEQAAEADLVLRAQQQLHQQGFYVRDNIDGRWGPATSTAVGNFQRANGLAATGQLDAPTRKALGLDPEPLMAAAPAAGDGAAPAAATPAPPAPGAAASNAPARLQPVTQTQ